MKLCLLVMLSNRLLVAVLESENGVLVFCCDHCCVLSSGYTPRVHVSTCHGPPASFKVYMSWEIKGGVKLDLRTISEG
jgi:hypothetical protein